VHQNNANKQTEPKITPQSSKNNNLKAMERNQKAKKISKKPQTI
jgi:hypothetical protein